MPSEDQLREYANSLPEIYREILEAFPRLEPDRKHGHGLAFQSVAADFLRRNKPYGLGEVIEAGRRLEGGGLIEVRNRIFMQPTELGERLIGIRAEASLPAAVPDLPAPTW